MRLAVDDGDSIDSAMRRAGPPVHFTREQPVGEALRAFSAPRLLRAMSQLADASLEARRHAGMRPARSSLIHAPELTRPQ